MKKKIIGTISSVVLLSSLATALPENPVSQISHSTQNEAQAASKTKYKLESVKSKNVSVKQQKTKAKNKAISDGIISLGVGGLPGIAGKGGSALLTVLGIKGNIDQIGKKYVPITVKKYHYVPTKKTKNKGKIMSGYNEGYYVFKVFNQKTKKQIGKSKKVYIQRG